MIGARLNCIHLASQIVGIAVMLMLSSSAWHLLRLSLLIFFKDFIQKDAGRKDGASPVN
nr:hypothetical protein Iba_chr15aCG5270 [Ipomoea batatas]GME00348.1 hypothetical protein Iba_chr15fCG4520 [Ipomoea batatas]